MSVHPLNDAQKTVPVGIPAECCGCVNAHQPTTQHQPRSHAYLFYIENTRAIARSVMFYASIIHGIRTVALKSTQICLDCHSCTALNERFTSSLLCASAGECAGNFICKLIVRLFQQCNNSDAVRRQLSKDVEGNAQWPIIASQWTTAHTRAHAKLAKNASSPLHVQQYNVADTDILMLPLLW